MPSHNPKAFPSSEKNLVKEKSGKYRVFHLKKFDSGGCCELVFGLLRSPKASM